MVSLDEIAAAMRLVAERARVIAEGAAACAVAAALSGRIPSADAGDARIVAVVSGGNVDLSRFAALTGANNDVVVRLAEEFNANLPMLKEFILPGGGPAAAVCHLARTVCRRAERHMVTLARSEAVNAHGPAYLNRLSDLLFVLGRVLARDEGGSEVLWRNDRGRRRPVISRPRRPRTTRRSAARTASRSSSATSTCSSSPRSSCS